MAVAVKFTSVAANKDLTDVSVNPEAAPTSTPRQGGFTLRNRVNFDNVANANKLLWVIDDATLNDDAINNFRILEVPERVHVHDVQVFAVASETQPMFKLTGAKAANASISSGDLSTLYVAFGADRNKKPTDSASYAAATHLVTLTTVNGEIPTNNIESAGVWKADAPFGTLECKVTASDASHPTTASLANVVFEDTFKKVDSSIGSPLEPMQTSKKPMINSNVNLSGVSGISGTAWEVVAQPPGEYFPYGGYVNMKLGPYNTSIASGANAAAAYFSGTTAATLYLHGTWEFQARCSYVPE